jgi:hypothetical protein
MMAALYLVCAVSLAVVWCGGVVTLSGWLVARLARQYADELELLVLCVLCGQSMLFALQGLAYVADMPQPVVGAGVVLLTVVAGAVFIRDGRHGRARPREFLPGLLAWCGLSIVLLAGSVLLVVHGMPGTYWDWWEHYYRSQLFQRHLPPTRPIGALWSLASRGPMFNAVAAALMQLMGQPNYWKFSIAATLLNAQIVLPLALLLRQFTGLSTIVALVVAAVFLAVSPFCEWNLIFTSPKMACSAGILAALAFALEGITRKDSRLVAWGVFAVAVAFLQHYMAFLYAVVLLPCLIYFVLRERLALRPIAKATGLGLALTGVWMLFLVHEFGIKGTLQANSTLGAYGGWGADLKVKPSAPPGRIELIGLNLASTVVPVSLRTDFFFEGSPLETPRREEVFAPPSRTGTGPSADSGLIFRIGAIEPALGASGLALLLAAAASFAIGPLRSRPWPRFSGFWLYLVLVGIPANLAALGWYCVYGTLVQNLQPYVCLAAVLVVNWLLTWPIAWRLVLAGLWLGECGIRTGYILLYQTRILPIHATADGIAVDAPFLADADYFRNYELKLRTDAVLLRDMVPDTAQAIVAAVALLVVGLLCFYLMTRPAKRTKP